MLVVKWYVRETVLAPFFLVCSSFSFILAGRLRGGKRLGRPILTPSSLREYC